MTSNNADFFSLRCYSMGAEYRNGYTINVLKWEKYYPTLDAAKAEAEKDRGKPINWQDLETYWYSGHLLISSYEIVPRLFEK